MFQYYPKNTQKHQVKTGAGIKKQYAISPPKKKFFAPALTRQGARGSGFARAIAPVLTNFHGGFTALTQPYRIDRKKGASWSLNFNWPSGGANLLAHMQLKCILYVPLCSCCVLVFLCFWEIIN